MDGFEATRRIRAEEPPDRHASIVAMTTHAMLGDRERLPHAWMDDSLSQPLDKAAQLAILNIVNDVLQLVPIGSRRLELSRETPIRRPAERTRSRLMLDF